MQTQRYTRAWLTEEYQQGNRRDMRFFWGHHPAKSGVLTVSCFSQWWQGTFKFDGCTFCCMEQVMMAGKARLFHDEETYEAIMHTTDPVVIKKLGRQVKGFDEAIWNEHKFSLILAGNISKFTSTPELQDFLLATGDDILVEASPYDRIWGIGLAAEDERAQDPVLWQGENLLGFALMQARDEIRKSKIDA